MGWPERVLGVSSMIALTALLAVSAWAWPRLPETIPIHFGFDGRPDGWGDRSYFWLLPVVGVALYAMLTVLARAPHAYNYPWPITEENAARQYRLARRLVLGMRLVLMVIFLHLLIGAVAVALKARDGFSVETLAAELIAIGLLLGGYLIAARRAH